MKKVVETTPVEEVAETKTTPEVKKYRKDFKTWDEYNKYTGLKG